MTDLSERLRRVGPYLVEDILGVCALIVIFLGTAQIAAMI